MLLLASLVIATLVNALGLGFNLVAGSSRGTGGVFAGGGGTRELIVK
jgi:hypothetical protein